jgi:hypothetical protein
LPAYYTFFSFHALSLFFLNFDLKSLPMPRFAFSIFCFFVFFQNADAQNVRVASEPGNIMIYTQGAVVKRSFSANIQQGLNEITVTGISSFTDERSITIIAPPDLQITRVSFSTNPGAARVPYRFRMAADSLDTLNAKLRLLRNFKSALSDELILLRENRKIAASDKGIFVDDLEEAADFFRVRIADILNRMDATDKKISLISAQIHRLQVFLQLFPTGEIHLTVQSASDQNAVFGLSYKTAGVSWTPFYELYIQENQQAVLNYYARIRQLTGENWNNGQITLNTSALYLSDSSVLKPWLIGDGNSTAANIYNAIQTTLPLNGIANLPSDSQETRVLIKKEMINFAAQYILRPELSAFAQTFVQIPDWQNYAILPGSMNLYSGSAYLGNVSIAPSMLYDTLNVFAGQDESIEVARVKLKDVSQKQFFSSTIRQTFGYALTVKNNKQSAQKVILVVHIPISMSKDIEVKLENSSRGSYDPSQGIIRWELSLNPGQVETLPYSWSVKYPKGGPVSGIE